jgi:hypothetical protein
MNDAVGPSRTPDTDTGLLDKGGTNMGDSAAARVSRPARAALRQAKRCCGVISCRRATSDYDSSRHIGFRDNPPFVLRAPPPPPRQGAIVSAGRCRADGLLRRGCGRSSCRAVVRQRLGYVALRGQHLADPAYDTDRSYCQPALLGSDAARRSMMTSGQRRPCAGSSCGIRR